MYTLVTNYSSQHYSKYTCSIVIIITGYYPTDIISACQSKLYKSKAPSEASLLSSDEASILPPPSKRGVLVYEQLQGQLLAIGHNLSGKVFHKWIENESFHKWNDLNIIYIYIFIFFWRGGGHLQCMYMHIICKCTLYMQYLTSC